MFNRYQHIHFIGIGGSGISALAHLALRAGKRVTGSDAGESVFTEAVKRAGATVFLGHQASHVSATVDLVIYTEAIDKTANPEYRAARERDLTALSYFEALGQLSARKKTIAITGTHGKTTTTGMLGVGLAQAGLDPTVIVGSSLREFNGLNVRFGAGDLLVAEACEYRRSFLNLHPFGMLMLNGEPDHLDYYKDEADYVSAYRELAAKLSADGFLIYNAEDANAASVAAGFAGRRIPVDSALVRELDMTLRLAGGFNRFNAVCAFLAGRELGAAEAPLRAALAAFHGAGRRMEIKGAVNGATVIDDYGHHPTEVRLTLRALRERYPDRRIVCVFQPHQYNRTAHFLDDFATAFADANQVIIPNIYEARDTAADKQSTSAEALAAQIARHHADARFGGGLKATEAYLRKTLGAGDVVVVVGAGDVSGLARDLVETEAPSR